MDIFKKLGITVGYNTSLIQESVSKSEQDQEIVHNNIIRKGAGLSPRDILEQQLAKGGISITPMSDEEMADEDEKMKAKVINPHIKGSHGEEFHSDNDKQVEEMVSEGEVIQSEFDHEKPMKVEFKSMSVLDALSDIVKGGEGSRGGKIIGHTKSGKPIYEPAIPHAEVIKKRKKQMSQGLQLEPVKQAHEYEGYSKEDHKDAAEAHARIARQSINHRFGTATKVSQHHRDAESFHEKMAKESRFPETKKSDDAVSRKISKLVKEGKPQKQAVAIALDMERRGDLGKADVKMPKEKFVQEHKKLVNVLESPSHKDDMKEAKEQKKELKDMGKAGKYCKSIDSTLDDIIKGMSVRVPKHAPKPEKSKEEKKIERQLLKEQMGKAEMPEGVSKKEFKKMANLHENSDGVAERRKASPFIKSQGPGGIVFDFGFKTGNALADHATALLNQNADPVQSANANYTANSYNKALESYVTKGEQAYMQTATPYGNVDEAWSKQLNTPMDTQVKEAFEKGQFSDDNSTPAVINQFNKTEMNLGGQVIKATSETDAALIEMMRSSLIQDDGSGMIAEIGGSEGRVAEIS